MPMRYADADDVLTQLKLDTENPAHAETIARVERLENGLCDAFDHKVGRSFAAPVPPVPETRTVWGDGGAMLALEPGAVTVASVAIGGTWDGTAWIDETVLEASDWAEVIVSATGRVHALMLLASATYATYQSGIVLHAGVWSGPVRVTAVWDDQMVEGVPDDVREALTFITVDEYRTRTASPAGEIGPDGLMVPVRNPWRYELVRTAIARHRVRRVKAGV